MKISKNTNYAPAKFSISLSLGLGNDIKSKDGSPLRLNPVSVGKR